MSSITSALNYLYPFALANKCEKGGDTSSLKMLNAAKAFPS